MTTRTPFVVFEGIDGAGTTTQTARLIHALHARQQAAISTREPSDGPIGMMLRQMLAMRIVLQAPGHDPQPMTRETLALLFAADRLDHVAAVVSPHLEQGTIVVSDRYYHSSLAYQGDVEEGAQQADYRWVMAINERARIPDLTFFLRIDLDTSLQRLDRRASRDLYETRDKLARLILRYDEVITSLKQQGQHIIELDATLPIDVVHEQVMSHLDSWSKA